MDYEPPCRCSETDSGRLLALLAGRSLSRAEARRWFFVLREKRKLLPGIAFFLCFLNVIIVISLFPEASLPRAERMIAAGILLLAIGWLFVAACSVLLYPKIRARRRFSEYEADVKRHNCGCRIELYDDRVEITTVRGTRRLCFSEIEQCVETADGFALIQNATCLILRSNDLTAYDLQWVRELLTERLVPEMWQCREMAQAGLLQPLPIPHFEATAPLTTATVPFAATSVYRRERKARLFRLLAAMGPLALIGGTMTALLLALTNSFFMDLILFIGVWLIGVLLVGLGFFFLLEQRCWETLRLAFEPDGLRLKTDTDEQFIIKERLGLLVEESGVTIHFLHHTSLFIPSNAVEDQNVLRALVGIE